MDKERFYDSVQKIMNEERQINGIGTYGEKTMHAVLKNYFEPYSDGHEQKIGGFVADIVGEDGIIEIQTAGFEKLRKKLEVFLPVSRVTVVYPIPRNKWIVQFDPETGRRGKRRRSPVTGSVADVFAELYKIKTFISHENFRLCIVMTDVEELRVPPEKNGLKRGRRRGYVRFDRIPLDIADEIYVGGENGWGYFIPDSLPEEFTSLDLGTASGVGQKYASFMLNVLSAAGAVERIGKKGNSYIYRSSGK